MSPKAIAVAGLSAIAIAASGCSGDSDPEAEFRAAFKKSFGEAPWYHHITGMEVAAETVAPPSKSQRTSVRESDTRPARSAGRLCTSLSTHGWATGSKPSA